MAYDLPVDYSLASIAHLQVNRHDVMFLNLTLCSLAIVTYVLRGAEDRCGRPTTERLHHTR